MLSYESRAYLVKTQAKAVKQKMPPVQFFLKTNKKPTH